MADIMKFTREYYIYFAIYPAIKSFYDYIKQQEDEGKLPPKIDKKILDAIISEGKCQICGNTLDDEHLLFVSQLQKLLSVSSATSAELNKSMAAIEAFISNMKKYPEKKDSYFKELQDIKKKIKDNDDEYKQLSDFLKNIPNNEKLADEVTNRESFQSALTEMTKKLGAEESILKKAKDELYTAEEILKKTLLQNKKFEQIRQDIEFCKKCKVLLDDVKNNILIECRNSMQEATFDIFRKLLWKKDAFAEIRILNDYTFQLLNSYGEQTLGSCSAAERVLLALSFTLALQEISKHDSLLYIDTPIGRVDPENRSNFMKVLLDIASEKQVILTFTPTEYDVSIQSLLNNKYSTMSKLKMIDNITTIEIE